VGWSILKNEEAAETSNPSYVKYIRQAFGDAYRLSDKNWNKVKKGNFFNPARHIGDFNAKKVIMFHAKDDPYIPWKVVSQFAHKTGIRLYSFARGGHLETTKTIIKYWARISAHFC
jgi:predicted alpha/beta hydrolase family esterase